MISAPVIEVGGSDRGVVRRSPDIFKHTAVFKVRRDPGRPKAVIAHLPLRAGGDRTPANHRLGFSLGPGVGVSFIVPLPRVPNKGPLGSLCTAWE